MNWAMTATISARQKTTSDPTQMHIKLSVKNELDQNGDYAYLPDNCIVQTYFQIRNKGREVELVEEAEVTNFLAEREREELIAQRLIDIENFNQGYIEERQISVVPDTPVELISTGPFIYYENYVTSFDYVPADLGEVPEARFRGVTSCGEEILGEIDGKTFREVEASNLSCGFYQEDLQDYYIMNSTRKGVLFTSGFFRRLADKPL